MHCNNILETLENDLGTNANLLENILFINSIFLWCMNGSLCYFSSRNYFARLAYIEIVFICRCSRQSWRTLLKDWRNWGKPAQIINAMLLWIRCWDICGGFGQCSSAEWNHSKQARLIKKQSGETLWYVYVIFYFILFCFLI